MNIFSMFDIHYFSYSRQAAQHGIAGYSFSDRGGYFFIAHFISC